ncbi:hypothetical protein Q4488_14355 [Amphritea sp. 1_MG-2023]|uniref:hypothetical protein n=1 Tax=Amphritea sp. 1_MG-2023 TaxID=3062670 RepID=UPI0026E26BB3|nr:hypothetical protein [Amphritea sp. 1_MG-2023]MDO6564565.1 hypothetical protein [Amphritea sp. 1_MG-2023]
MSAFNRFIITLMLTTIASSALAIQVTDPRSAAVYIVKQRPLINACLSQAQASNTVADIWTNSACQQLLNHSLQLKTAWQFILPNGNTTGLAEVPSTLRQATVDSYSDYKQLAERIAQLSH